MKHCSHSTQFQQYSIPCHSIFITKQSPFILFDLIEEKKSVTHKEEGERKISSCHFSLPTCQGQVIPTQSQVQKQRENINRKLYKKLQSKHSYICNSSPFDPVPSISPFPSLYLLFMCTIFFSCLSFQPSTLSFQSTFPRP